MMMMILLLCFLVFIAFLFLKKHPAEKKSYTPASPPRLPVIGNLHQLGFHPHRSLRSLSQKYGPLMLLHLGSVPVLVVSSAEVAKDFLRTHDLAFASRPRTKIFEKLSYKERDIALAFYGEYWRQMKSVSVLHLLSNKMVRSFAEVRKEEVNLMMEKIRKSGSLRLNLSEFLMSLTNNVISRVALGHTFDNKPEIMHVMEKLVELLGAFSIGSYVPWLGWIDWIRGLDAELEKTSNDFDDFLEEVVQEHANRGGNGTDFVDVLLNIQKDKSVGFEIDRLSIKAIILNVFVGGTDTSFTVMEWAMTELLRNPECLKKLQEEVRTICKGKSSVFEEDIQEMKYLKAVIKETLRLHPALPLLVPHESTQEVALRDYHIPAGTQVIINGWAIGREAATWGPDAEEFKPERHLDSSIDFRGQNFELIPFGAGRRFCPGISFAIVLNEVVLANLMHQFDWQSTEDQTDVAESTGIAVHRMFPLYVIATSASNA